MGRATRMYSDGLARVCISRHLRRATTYFLHVVPLATTLSIALPDSERLVSQVSPNELRASDPVQ